MFAVFGIFIALKSIRRKTFALQRQSKVDLKGLYVPQAKKPWFLVKRYLEVITFH